MLEKILLMRLDLFIIRIKKMTKEFMEQHLKKKLKELREEGINAETIPWIEDKKN